MRYQAAPLPDAGDPLGGIDAGGKRLAHRDVTIAPAFATTRKGASRGRRPSLVPFGHRLVGRDAYFLAGAAVLAASARIESAALFRLSEALLTAAEATLLDRSLA